MSLLDAYSSVDASRHTVFTVSPELRQMNASALLR